MIFAGVTARQVCTPRYASRVRDVSSATKRRIYLAYGIRRHAPFEYEIDHLISLELASVLPARVIESPTLARLVPVEPVSGLVVVVG